MRNKTQIGLLAAAAAFAMQAHAHGGAGFHDSSMSDGSTAPEMLTVFEPDGSAFNVSNGRDWTSPGMLTAFDSDGSAYNITPIDLEVAYLEPGEISLDDQALPDQLTVFEPNGDVHSYMFTPQEPTLIVEPLDIIAMDDDFSVVAFSDHFSAPLTYVANYISPPSYTGILDQ